MQQGHHKVGYSCIPLVVFLALSFSQSNLFSNDGDLDPTFGIGGKVTTDLIGPNNEYGYDSAIQDDGKIILVGRTYLRDRSSQAILIRLFSDGTLDPGFGDGGKLIISNPKNSAFQAVEIQPDGKVLAAGAVGTFGNIDFLLMRFNSDGSPDTTFGANGIVTIDWDEEDSFNDLAIQTDGKIVTVGFTGYFEYDSGHNWWFAITRFNSDGSVDTSFGDQGKVLAFGGNDEGDSANSVSVQSDGKIVVGGNACCDDQSATDFGIVRLNTNGTVDASFGINGQIFTDFNKSSDPFHSSSDVINSIAIQPDNKIVVAGIAGEYYRSKIALVRYQADGGLDTTFGKRGKVVSKISKINLAYDLKLQPDGQILIGAAAGRRHNNLDFVVLRYNNNGFLDNSFGTDGMVRTDFFNGEDEINSLLLLPNSDILAFGSAGHRNQSDLAAILYDNSGNIETNFGVEGKLSISFVSPSIQYLSAIKVDSDGRILAAGFDQGSPNSKPLIARYLANGSLDSSFGDNGVTSKWIGDFNDVDDLALTSDGKIILAGNAYRDYEQCIYIAKYDWNGSLDRTFGTKGIKCVSLPEFYEQLSAVAIQSDGKIVAVGSVSDSNFLFLTVRFNRDGTLDDSFGDGGIVVTSMLSGEDQFARAVAIQSDGKILVGGYLNDFNNGMGTGLQFALVRYNTDGTLDSDFGTGGIVRTKISTGSDAANSIVLQNDGKIVAGGYANDDLQETSDFALTRYLSDGSLDSTFGNGGIVRTDLSGDEVIKSLAILSNGKIIAVGYMQSNEQTQFVLARYDDDGSLDNSFGTGGKVITSFGSGNSYADSVVIQSDGKIVAGGSAEMDVTLQDFALARYESSQ